MANVLDCVPGDHESNLLTINEAAKLIGVTQSRTARFVSNGVLLCSAQDRKKGKRTLVRRESCKRFRSTYVTLAELAETFSVPKARIARRFAWTKLKWAKAPNGGYIRDFYPRGEAETFVRQRILPFSSEMT